MRRSAFQTAAGPPSSPQQWQVWSALGAIYVIWGSTYLAIRVMVETVPPALGAGVRFALAGVLMLGALSIRGGSWRGGAAAPPARGRRDAPAAVGLLRRRRAAGGGRQRPGHRGRARRALGPGGPAGRLDPAVGRPVPDTGPRPRRRRDAGRRGARLRRGRCPAAARRPPRRRPPGDGAAHRPGRGVLGPGLVPSPAAGPTRRPAGYDRVADAGRRRAVRGLWAGRRRGWPGRRRG